MKIICIVFLSSFSCVWPPPKRMFCVLENSKCLTHNFLKAYVSGQLLTLSISSALQLLYGSAKLTYAAFHLMEYGGTIPITVKLPQQMLQDFMNAHAPVPPSIVVQTPSVWEVTVSQDPLAKWMVALQDLNVLMENVLRLSFHQNAPWIQIVNPISCVWVVLVNLDHVTTLCVRIPSILVNLVNVIENLIISAAHSNPPFKESIARLEGQQIRNVLHHHLSLEYLAYSVLWEEMDLWQISPQVVKPVNIPSCNTIIINHVVQCQKISRNVAQDKFVWTVSASRLISVWELPVHLGNSVQMASVVISLTSVIKRQIVKAIWSVTSIPTDVKSLWSLTPVKMSSVQLFKSVWTECVCPSARMLFVQTDTHVLMGFATS